MEDLSGIKGLQKELLENKNSIFIRWDGVNRVFKGDKRLNIENIGDLIEEEDFTLGFIKDTDYVLFSNTYKYSNEVGEMFLEDTFDYKQDLSSNILIAHIDKLAPEVLNILPARKG